MFDVDMVRVLWLWIWDSMVGSVRGREGLERIFQCLVWVCE